MRDGNLNTSGQFSYFKLRLKPTYEGWKPLNDRDPVGLILSLKPTYEGWKPSWVWAFAASPSVFEAYL